MFWLDGALYLITKERDVFEPPSLFRLDLERQSQKPLVAQQIGRLQMQGNVTDAAYSENQGQLAVLTYHGIYFWDMQSVDDVLQPPRHFVHSVTGWTEALCYDGDSLILTDEPGYLLKKPLSYWLRREKLIPPEFPRLVLSKTENAPKLDGDLQDWNNAVILPMHYEVYSKYQTEPETSNPSRVARLQWTAEGLYLGIPFANPDVQPNFRERVMVLLAPVSESIFLDPENPVFMIFKTGTGENAEWKIDNIRTKQSVGRVASQERNNQTIVEAVIQSEHLENLSFEPGHVLRFNLLQMERSRENGKVIGWYWASRFSFVDNHPDLWGYLELK
jgi:hypothetical protein